jgi:hypothetical protein
MDMMFQRRNLKRITGSDLVFNEEEMEIEEERWRDV